MKTARLKPSRRSDIVSQSEIRAMSVACERVGGINLSQGVCDTEVPEVVRRAAQQAIDEGTNSYTRCDGLHELRRALARHLQAHRGLAFDPETEVVVSAGATGALYCAAFALLEPGDEVILFEPYYGYHVQTLLAAGAVPAFVELRVPNWSLRREDLERAVTRRTRAVLVNTPANPSGKVFSRAELEWIASFATEYDLFVFTDEIYEHFLFDGRQHTSPAALPGLAERTITISGLSKTFGITGWRIGYAACRSQWARPIAQMNDLVYVCAPAPFQQAVARGLDALGPDYYAGLRAEYTAKRDLICAALDAAGLPPHVPEGAYYVLADVSRLAGATSKARAMNLLETTGVATVPGEAFFRGPEGHALTRLCFAKPAADLEEACRRLRGLG